MQTGTIKWFNSTKGYGFIEPSDKSRDVFVHISAVQHLDINKLDPGTKVSFETEKQYGKLGFTAYQGQTGNETFAIPWVIAVAIKFYQVQIHYHSDYRL